VDPQGNLLAGKVLGAERSEELGGPCLPAPLKEAFPHLKLIRGDSHDGGALVVWVKEQLGWIVQTIYALTLPKRGLLVPEEEEVDWETVFPQGFRPQPRR